MSYATFNNDELLGEELSNEEVSVEESQDVDRSGYGKYSHNNGNCINYQDKEFHLQELTSLNEDQCFLKERTQQSVSVGNYNLSNFNTCDCNINQVVKRATDNPAIVFRDGYGISECNVNNDSELRIGKTRKFPKCPDQLFTRPIITVPFMGRGSGNAEIEHQVIQGEQTREKRECNVLSGVTIENFFTPLIDSVEENIQKPENLIQEDNDKRWIRGGIPSRQIVKDIDYLQRCADNLENKELLVGRKGYLSK